MRGRTLAILLAAAALPTAAAVHATGYVIVTAYLVEDASFAYFTVYACASDASHVRATLVWLPQVRGSRTFDMGALEQRGVGSCGWWMDRIGVAPRHGDAPPAECVRVDARLVTVEGPGVGVPVAAGSDEACVPSYV